MDGGLARVLLGFPSGSRQAVSKFEFQARGKAAQERACQISLKGHGNGADNSLTGGADMLGSLSCLWPNCAYPSAS